MGNLKSVCIMGGLAMTSCARACTIKARQNMKVMPEAALAKF